jgi:hypothetical protein
MVQWNDAVEEIPMPNYNETDGFWPDDSSNSSQSMDELVNGNGTLGQDETFFESLNDLALDDIAREVGSDKAFLDNMKDMSNLDSSDVDSMSSDGKTGYMAAGARLLAGAVLLKAQAFFVRIIASMRNMSAENDDVDELVDVDDIKNAAACVGKESAA